MLCNLSRYRGTPRGFTSRLGSWRAIPPRGNRCLRAFVLTGRAKSALQQVLNDHYTCEVRITLSAQSIQSVLSSVRSVKTSIAHQTTQLLLVYRFTVDSSCVAALRATDRRSNARSNGTERVEATLPVKLHYTQPRRRLTNAPRTTSRDFPNLSTTSQNRPEGRNSPDCPPLPTAEVRGQHCGRTHRPLFNFNRGDTRLLLRSVRHRWTTTPEYLSVRL